MNNKKYDLTFYEVIEELINNGGWYQGEKFSNGTYLAINGLGNVCVYSFSEEYFGTKELYIAIIYKGVVEQKYRKVETQADVMRKV
ncbi:MAG: hypothetical protein LUH21_04475 [Clostridiales bacterium]|nr:hypothetical protein [Clostridiales bacterium]